MGSRRGHGSVGRVPPPFVFLWWPSRGERRVGVRWHCSGWTVVTVVVVVVVVVVAGGWTVPGGGGWGWPSPPTPINDGRSLLWWL